MSTSDSSPSSARPRDLPLIVRGNVRLTVRSEWEGAIITLLDGKLEEVSKVDERNPSLQLYELAPGLYLLRAQDEDEDLAEYILELQEDTLVRIVGDKSTASREPQDLDLVRGSYARSLTLFPSGGREFGVHEPSSSSARKSPHLVLRCEEPNTRLSLYGAGPDRSYFGASRGQFESEVPRGLYLVRSDLLGKVQETIVPHFAESRPISISSPPYQSATPLACTGGAEEDSLRIEELSKDTDFVRSDGSAGLLIYVRPSDKIVHSQVSELPVLRLLDHRREDVRRLENAFDHHSEVAGDLSSGFHGRFQPGQYYLQLCYAKEYDTVEIPILLFEGWQTQLFLLHQDGRVCLNSLRVLTGPVERGFDPRDEQAEWTDKATAGLFFGECLVPPATREYLRDAHSKSLNPMLGLVALHALRLEEPIDRELMARILEKLGHRSILISDLQALAILSDLEPVENARSLENPPLFADGLQALYNSAERRTDLIGGGSWLDQIEVCEMCEPPWSAWDPDCLTTREGVPAKLGWVHETLLNEVARLLAAGRPLDIDRFDKSLGVRSSSMQKAVLHLASFPISRVRQQWKGRTGLIEITRFIRALVLRRSEPLDWKDLVDFAYNESVNAKIVIKDSYDIPAFETSILPKPKKDVANSGPAHATATLARTKAGATYIWGTGRRKTAVARVRIREGTGIYLINKLEVDAYFTGETQRSDVRAPLRVTEMGERIDVFVNVKGSGKNSQSGAVLLGLARALSEYRPDLLPILREGDFLTRDARMVERKKYGHKKARKSFQFSKR